MPAVWQPGVDRSSATGRRNDPGPAGPADSHSARARPVARTPRPVARCSRRCRLPRDGHQRQVTGYDRRQPGAWSRQRSHRALVSAWPVLALVGSFELLMTLVRRESQANAMPAHSAHVSRGAPSAPNRLPPLGVAGPGLYITGASQQWRDLPTLDGPRAVAWQARIVRNVTGWPYCSSCPQANGTDKIMSNEAVQDRAVTELTAGRGRGPASHLLAAAEPACHCHVPHCNEQIDPSRLMCRRHWYRVPKQLRDQVWATWQSGRGTLSSEHQSAVRMAVSACRDRTGSESSSSAA
jgi:hypothetical protein